MLGWIVRVLLVLAGFITSLFVSRDALKFDVIQMVVAVLLFTLLVAIVAFWPMLKAWFMRVTRKEKKF
ncbi:MAG: hypothetical protein ACD_60C00024G0014 [uncultured bacterium]|nr:MAG: hypothetical protein ACD_60C00024G0014 [uncultured bacterium]